MIVVADTTPLVHLSRIGRVDLIPRLFEVGLIPRAVWLEVENAVYAPCRRGGVLP